MNTPSPASAASPDAPRPRGPWTHRALVWFFSLLFGLLVFWLLGFVLRDLGSWPGPAYTQLEQTRLDPALLADLDQTRQRLEEATRAIADDQKRQSVLRDSITNSERTLNQLLELHRLALQKGVSPTGAEQTNLHESEQLFLQNQRQYQAISERIATRTEELRSLEERQRTLQRDLEQRRQPLREEFQRLQTRHDLRLAAAKLGFLVPLLVVAVFLVLKRRTSLYAPLLFGFGLATALKVGFVLHQHFPRRYFKYVLLGVALLLVARILVYLLRAVARPKTAWLLKQYREAYENFLCPICGYPIRRGPLRYLAWNRRSLRKLPLPADPAASPEEPYVCPVCATSLFGPCPACQAIRHSLLPACTRCGARVDPTAPAVLPPAPAPNPAPERPKS